MPGPRSAPEVEGRGEAESRRLLLHSIVPSRPPRRPTTAWHPGESKSCCRNPPVCCDVESHRASLTAGTEAIPAAAIADEPGPSMRRDPRSRKIAWRYTGSLRFPWAAEVDGTWWVLRLNDFPDHPLLTLFIDGERSVDFEDSPEDRWPMPTPWVDHPDDPAEWALTPAERLKALSPARRSGRLWRAEVGRPCDGDFCGCSSAQSEVLFEVADGYPFAVEE